MRGKRRPVYQTFLEMVDWADRVGVHTIALSEHHGDQAGWTPSPTTVAAAVLARTRRSEVLMMALAPLHDPVRLAEQLAVADCSGPGRLSVVVGAGYWSREFDMADLKRRDRGRLVEEALDVFRLAWTGEPFSWKGRTVLVTPRPATDGGPRINARRKE